MKRYSFRFTLDDWWWNWPIKWYTEEWTRCKVKRYGFGPLEITVFYTPKLNKNLLDDHETYF